MNSFRALMIEWEGYHSLLNGEQNHATGGMNGIAQE